MNRLCTLTLLTALWLPATGMTQSPDPQALVQGFASAWNAHDPNAFEKLFFEEADWVTAAGQGAAPSRGNNIFVASRHSGRWTVVAGQVASQRN